MNDSFMRNVPSKVPNLVKNGPMGKVVDAFGKGVKNFVNNARQTRQQVADQAVEGFVKQNNMMNWPKPPSAQEYANHPLMQRDYLKKSPTNGQT